MSVKADMSVRYVRLSCLSAFFIFLGFVCRLPMIDILVRHRREPFEDLCADDRYIISEVEMLYEYPTIPYLAIPYHTKQYRTTYRTTTY